MLEITGLWEAHTLLLPPSQSPARGVAREPCLQGHQMPQAGRIQHPARTGLAWPVEAGLQRAGPQPPGVSTVPSAPRVHRKLA